MTYDSVRRVCLVVEGPLLAQFGGLWSWNGAVWSQLVALNNGPEAVSELVFDSGRGVAVIYTSPAAQTPGHTWEWNGTFLMRVSTNGPPSRMRAGMAYDSRRGRTVLFGGNFPVEGIEASYTWEWDGFNWTVVADPFHSPERRRGCAMAYDAERQVVVMFGGSAGTTQGSPTFRETWTWNGTTWALVSTGGPSGREAHQMVYDNARKKVLLFGGTDGTETGGNLGLNDLWEWDGSQWTQLSPPSSPPPRYDPGFAYDSSRRQAVLFGGLRRVAGNLIDLNDTWVLDPQSVWVDFAYVGTENGTFAMPFNTVVEGVSAAPTGGLVRIKPGSGSEKPTISKRVTLDAPIGAATIGRP